MTYIPSRDWLVAVQKGEIEGHSLVHKFGRNDAVASGTWSHVSLLSAATSFLTAATTVRIRAGGNAADTAAGAGAREVTVQGLGPGLHSYTPRSPQVSYPALSDVWLEARGNGGTAAVSVDFELLLVDN